ncbi:MAG: DUF4091 domain-containing protein, partial [Deltaproteobacteria bacterium]|nr:DUF4091 domain-containing protein [Deltaproteobacteria bacterium]
LHGSAQPPVSQRLIGWYLYRYGLRGYLVWAVNSWPEDPWTSPPSQKDAGRRGVFFYPDPQTGLPLPTVRLESLRRGWEDYLYLDMFAKAHQRGAVPDEVFRRVQEKFIRLTANLGAMSPAANWADLEELRLEMGEALNRTAQ